MSRREISPTGVEWENLSSVFGAELVAEVDGYELRIFSVVGGSNTDTYPWGWSVDSDGDEVGEGAARTGREAAAEAEAFARRSVAS